MSGNIQNLLRRAGKPRVHITMDVENSGLPQKELPFVVGVLGDLSGDRDPQKEVPSFVDRDFVEIGRDNFSRVMKQIGPRVDIDVDDKLGGGNTPSGSQAFNLKLVFNSMEDFEPANIVERVPQLKALLETRAKLRDLLTKADRSEALEKLLEQILKDENDRKRVASDLGLESAKE